VINAAVSVAEYRVGIELTDTTSRAAERARALGAIMSAVDVLDYTQTTAAHHAPGVRRKVNSAWTKPKRVTVQRPLRGVATGLSTFLRQVLLQDKRACSQHSGHSPESTSAIVSAARSVGSCCA
jgi:hypothetical protein